MTELTQEHLIMIQETHDKIIRIETLLGNGDAGLCRQVSTNTKRINSLCIILAFIGGGGGVALGVVELLKSLGG